MSRKILKWMIIISVCIFLISAIFSGYIVKGANDNINTYIHKNGILPFYHEDYLEINTYNLILDYRNNVVYQKSEDGKDIQGTITKNQKISDAKIIEIINNGYPNKAPEDLGCDNIEQAYMATQEAIYTIIDNKNIDRYISYNEAGKNVINAIKIILNSSLSSDKIINMESIHNEWKEEGEYLTKQYRLNILRQIYNSSIEIEENNIFVTDINGAEKVEFADGDIIKIMIPKNAQLQNLNIKFKGQLQENGGYICSDNNGKEYLYVQKDYYNIETVKKIQIKELLNIKIVNKDNDTKEPIVGNQFELYKYNNLIKDNLVTDAKGEILIENLPKAVYNLRQTSVIEGYTKISSSIEINLEETNKLATINVNNSKAKVEQTTNREQEINVTEQNKEIQENNITDILNIYSENVFKDIINKTNEINLYKNNEFINTVNIKNVKNIKEDKVYNNTTSKGKVEEIAIKDSQNYEMTREDFINYMDNIKLSNNKIPILPLTGK